MTDEYSAICLFIFSLQINISNENGGYELLLKYFGEESNVVKRSAALLGK